MTYSINHGILKDYHMEAKINDQELYVNMDTTYKYIFKWKK